MVIKYYFILFSIWICGGFLFVFLLSVDECVCVLNKAHPLTQSLKRVELFINLVVES
jgi:hypothetical protein